ncbi:MAG: ribonuclease H-like domain-containing protein [Verrucomicrobiota bacterium]
MKNIVYFDLETKNSFDDVGGRNNMRALRVSIGVTYSSATGEYHIFDEHHVNDLIEELRRADLVVGYNILGFDYEVLIGHNVLFDPSTLPSLDLMADLAVQFKFRPSLDAVANATLGVEKTSDGLQAIRWYREGKLLEIAEYCCYDVKLTRMIHEYGRYHGQLYVVDRNNVKRSAPVKW